MRITIVNNHIEQVTGGSELQCDFIATGLAQGGHSVNYVLPNSPVAHDIQRPYDLTPFERNPRSLLAAALKNKPDVVYWRYNKHYFFATSKHLAKASVPTVFAVSHVNDTKPWSAKPSGKTRLPAMRRSLRRVVGRWNHQGFRYVEAATVNNEDLIRHSPVQATYLVENGMTDDYQPFSWPRPYVTWVATIKAAKRPELFVEVSKTLADYGIDCLMAGPIKSERYERLTIASATPPNFHYLGSLSLKHVNGLLRQSILHVHTCQPEGYSNIFIQAWLQGKPSISYDFDPAGHITRYGLGHVARGNIEDFTKSIAEWVTNENLATAAGVRARAFAQQHFSLRKMVNRVEEVLQSAASPVQSRE